MNDLQNRTLPAKVCIAVLLAFAFLSGCGGVTATLPKPPGGEDAREAPVPTRAIRGERLSSLSLDGAEIVAFHAGSGRAFVAAGKAVEIVDLADPSRPRSLRRIALGKDGTEEEVTSVAVLGDWVAAAVRAADKTEPGQVVFLSLDGEILGRVMAGALPDMVTFTPDGSFLLVVNEGEEDDGVDPPGSISLVDLSAGLEGATVTTIDFRSFDGQEDSLRGRGVRIFPGKKASEDFEPEYLSVAPDGTRAYVTLQENNALAILDLGNLEPGAARAEQVDVQVIPFGTKDHRLAENSFDASDKDGGIHLRPWPVSGMFMPDTIASFVAADGRTYIVTANEGDVRDVGDDEVDVRKLRLDPEAFPDAAELQEDRHLGRLEVSGIDGDLDGDGDFDRLFSYGARSFSVWDAEGRRVFDSGDDFARILSVSAPRFFNADEGDPAKFDERSRARGVEPEGVVVGELGGRDYAFVGLERGGGGVMIYDVSEPAEARFVDYLRHPDDISPEGLVFVGKEDSPIGVPLLLVTNEQSKNLTVYRLRHGEAAATPGLDEGHSRLQLLHASDLEGGVDAIGDAPNFAAVVEALEHRAEELGTPSILLSAGDNYISGPFFEASDTRAMRGVFRQVWADLVDGVDMGELREGKGRADVTIMNLIGFDASALGNHEFDLGTRVLADVIRTDAGAERGTRWLGSQFPYLSSNLDFTADGNLRDLFTGKIRASTDYRTTPGDLDGTPVAKIAPATLVRRGEERIGVVGVTTPKLENISSPGDTRVREPGAGSDDMASLAKILQPVIDRLTSQGLDKIIVVSHLQQVSLEKKLAGLLSGVDILVAGGSDTLQANPGDPLRPGDAAAEPYPAVVKNKDGEPAVIVSTDGQYSYVGCLVVEFDERGVVLEGSIQEEESGPFKTDDEGVAALWGERDPFADGTRGDRVRWLTSRLQEIVNTQDAIIFGSTSEFIEGRRELVRTEETTLGNLSADANLAMARQVDPAVRVSLKNAGGIRDAIGTIYPETRQLEPPAANPAAGKKAGEISQLDIQNSLKFNNGLALVTLTAEQLVAALEHGVAASGNGATPGQFPQVGGLRFSFDPRRAPGERVVSAALVDEDGKISDVLVKAGEIQGDPARTVRVVTLDFLAEGSDGYPLPSFRDADPALFDRVDLTKVGLPPGDATASPPGSEQDALAEYLLDHFPVGSPYAVAETPPSRDLRIQNLSAREDTVLGGSR